jgi:DNA-directed RNA polymerase specialized sigma24 family protein
MRVYRFALRLTRDESLAEDVVSEAFLRRAAPRIFSRNPRSRTLLLAIAHNKEGRCSAGMNIER